MAYSKSNSYFRQLPNLDYPSLANERTSAYDYQIVKNIFKRAILRDDIFNEVTAFTKYSVQGDERPDQVAFDFYRDSALDWAIYFAENSDNRVGLIHRSSNFRAHKESVDKIFLLEKQNKIKIYLNSQVTKLTGKNNLNQIIISDDSGNNTEVKSDHWFPLFGLIPRLGPILNWGLDIEKNAIVVNNTLDYSTNVKGIFAVGDINTYQGKLKLILCGFHEATVAVKAAYKLINPEKKYVMKYTTIQGVQGFEKNN